MLLLNRDSTDRLIFPIQQKKRDNFRATFAHREPLAPYLSFMIPKGQFITSFSQIKTPFQVTKTELFFQLYSSATRLPSSFDIRTVALRLSLSTDLPFRISYLYYIQSLHNCQVFLKIFLEN